MAEAMIIHRRLDASPNKMKQQLFSQQLYHNNHPAMHQQQVTNTGQNDNKDNFDGYLPGYMYNCYPYVVSPARSNSCQEIPGRNTTLLPSSQQQQVLNQASPFSQHQPVMLHNGLMPGGYISGFYSLVPLQSMLSNEVLPCQQTLMPSEQNYHNQHHHFQSFDGQGIPALLGPIVGYPLQYLTQHFQHQPKQQPSKSCNIATDGHKGVIIMKDASVQTEFNEKISERILMDLPNSFFMGFKDGFKNQSIANDISESHSLSKGTDTYSLLKSFSHSNAKTPVPHLYTCNTPGHLHSTYRVSNQQSNNFNPYLSNISLQTHFQNMSFPAQAMAFHQGQGLCFSPASYNNHVHMPPNMCHINVNPNTNSLHPANINAPTNRNDSGRRQKFYRKTRLDQGQQAANPIFEIKKEFSDIVDAIGSLVAKSGSVGNSEPSSSRASSKSADFSQNPSEEKIMTSNQGVKGHKNVRRNFTTRSINSAENGKFAPRNAFDVLGKMQSYLPLTEFGHLSFGINNGNTRYQSGMETVGWSPNMHPKSHDVRSTKRKQQKRQMLANKAAEEEMEEISKERDNLLKGIMTTKHIISGDNKAMNENDVDEAEVEIQRQENVGDNVGDDGMEHANFKADAKNEISTKFEDFDGDGSSLLLEFIDPPDVCTSNSRQVLKSITKAYQGNNSLDEDPSPLSQMSPLTFSPPLSCPNEFVNSDDAATGSVMSKIHSRRFREYCSQVLDKEIDDRCVKLLQDLVKFQDQMYHIDPSKAKLKKRFVLGLREVAKHLKMGKLKCVIISPNLEQTQNKGGLDEALKSIIETCQAQEVPFIFALGRRALGRACAKLVPVSVVGIFNYEGLEENFSALKNLTEKARDAYAEMVNSLKREATLQSATIDRIESLDNEDVDTPADLKDKCEFPSKSCIPTSISPPSVASVVPALGPSPGGFEKLFPHLGHSRTPSACSAISFVSSVLSEPISENFPQSEPEIESKSSEQNVDRDCSVEAKNNEADSKQVAPADCDEDSSKEKQIIPANIENSGSLSNEAVMDAGSGKMNLELAERLISDRALILESSTKSILMSIHENCELEIPATKVSLDPEQDQNGDALDGESGVESDPSTSRPCPASDEVDCYGKWLKKDRFSDRMRKNSSVEDFSDGNDADTEEDRGYKTIETTSRGALCDIRVHDGMYSLQTPLSGVSKARRRRSKEDKSDDDKTIIMSKDDDEALVFALESYSLDKSQRCSGSAATPSNAQVEVLLSRFTMTPKRQNKDCTKHARAGIHDSPLDSTAPQSASKDFVQERPLLSELSLTSSAASRIESWVAESQKALRGLALLAEEEDDDDDIDDGSAIDDDGDKKRGSGDDC